MKSDTFEINGFRVMCHSLNTLIIGSGAASLNAAVSLHSLGVSDFIIATAKWGAGTTNNAGSDKQTYYKLSLCGREKDSVIAMARDLFNGHCMHGDIALCEAQGSVRAFMNLVSLGVPFPQDKYGAWAGYKTDNDPRGRATSAGPYTSKIMFGVLAAEIKRREIRVLDNHHVVALLKDEKNAEIKGALAVNTNEKDPRQSLVLFNVTNIIMGTGGPGDIYSASVYPVSQNGSTGMALKAGASCQNLTETQFGIASLKFRWNLSGSFQQVIPRYYSTDKKGNDENEFLNKFFPDYRSLAKAIFLKGYQWPFDAEKIHNYGSSLIDLLVYREKEVKKRKVFLDFTRNITWEGIEIFDPGYLDPLVRNYLDRSGSLQGTPAERLRAMNPPALELYLEQNIDLTVEPLEIAVCAQHCNGGLKGNIWWESDLKHLFPVGEVNGSHGVSRPGGAALNSGQVGSFRAAQYISARYGDAPPEKEIFLRSVNKMLRSETDLAECWIKAGRRKDNESILTEIRERMSGSAGIIRDADNISKAAREAAVLCEGIAGRLGASSVEDLKDCYLLADRCLTHYVWLEAIRIYMEKGGRSRGSFIVNTGDLLRDGKIEEAGKPANLCSYDRQTEKSILEVAYSNGKVIASMVGVRRVPVQDLWFEKVWKNYREDNYFDC